MFAIGDTVVYPQHGAGRIVDIVEQQREDETCRYYLIQMLYNDMTVRVPVEGSDKTGLRPVISEDMVGEVLAVLRDDATNMPSNWSRRVRHNHEKIKSGDVLEIADVLRNLAVRDQDRGLSTGEKQMYGKVRRILASELMYAKGIGESDALDLLDGVLAEMRRPGADDAAGPQDRS